MDNTLKKGMYRCTGSSWPLDLVNFAPYQPAYSPTCFWPMTQFEFPEPKTVSVLLSCTGLYGLTKP